MALKAIERRVINNLIKRLSSNRPHTAPGIAAMLDDEHVQAFLQNWIVEPLKILADPNHTEADLNVADRIAG